MDEDFIIKGVHIIQVKENDHMNWKTIETINSYTFALILYDTIIEEKLYYKVRLVGSQVKRVSTITEDDLNDGKHDKETNKL